MNSMQKLILFDKYFILRKADKQKEKISGKRNRTSKQLLSPKKNSQIKS